VIFVTNDLIPYKLLPVRPFRAHWRNYEADHLEIVVDAHFTIPPTGNEYWDNRQNMLEAIFHAAKKTGVRFERTVNNA
jgi:hypothetical protein